MAFGKETTAPLRESGVLLANIKRKAGIGDGWQVKNGEGYEDSFANVLGGIRLDEFVEERKRKTGKAIVMDFMGYGQSLYKIFPDEGLAVALRSPYNVVGGNFSIIEGNVLRRKTWGNIKEWIETKDTREEKGFDLIMCRALGGFTNLGYNTSVGYLLLQRAWKLLQPEGGRILTQLPATFSFRDPVLTPTLIKNWVDLLNKTPGIEAKQSRERPISCPERIFRPTLSISKHAGAPDKLPMIEPNP